SKASKGPNEITSMLHYFLVSVTDDAKEIKLWADNCDDQNKNLYEFQLLKTNVNPINLCPQKLPLKGLSEEKQ
ncbi:17279_t:CDS:2, partial [Racocetra fulgida]